MLQKLGLIMKVVQKLKKLIKEAKKAGADVVKFQCYTPKNYVTIENKKYQNI